VQYREGKFNYYGRCGLSDRRWSAVFSNDPLSIAPVAAPATAAAAAAAAGDDRQQTLTSADFAFRQLVHEEPTQTRLELWEVARFSRLTHGQFPAKYYSRQ